MPSKSLSDLPATPSPSTLFAQPAPARQTLTVLFSVTSALLPHSFAVRGKSSRVFSMPCALFVKNAGVYPSRHFPISTVKSLTALDSILPESPSCKSFRMNTYEKQGRGALWLDRFPFSGFHVGASSFQPQIARAPKNVYPFALRGRKP